MYATVPLCWEIPTVKAPYPSCHAKSPAPVSFIHFDDPPFNNCIALASGMVAGNEIKI